MKKKRVYDQAQQMTGTSRSNIRNEVWLSNSVPPENRVPSLSKAHHYAVASLPHEVQKAWLEEAERKHLNVEQFRTLLKSVRLDQQEQRMYWLKKAVPLLMKAIGPIHDDALAKPLVDAIAEFVSLVEYQSKLNSKPESK